MDKMNGRPPTKMEGKEKKEPRPVSEIYFILRLQNASHSQFRCANIIGKRRKKKPRVERKTRTHTHVGQPSRGERAPAMGGFIMVETCPAPPISGPFQRVDLKMRIENCRS